MTRATNSLLDYNNLIIKFKSGFSLSIRDSLTLLSGFSNLKIRDFLIAEKLNYYYISCSYGKEFDSN
jgi:hypothetical protein